MRELQSDLSIFKKLNLEKTPVGVKYLYFRPQGMAQLEKSLALCEMLPEAQRRKSAFYFTRENENCFGKQALGMVGDNGLPFAESGELGVRLGLFQEARANKNLARQNYSLGKGTVRFVVLAPLDAINFEPDLLLFQTTPRQAEVLLRAMTYSTGEIYESKSSAVLSCSWLYVYPFAAGKVNYYITGMGFGSIGRAVFEPGWVLVSIPYNWLPTISQNLKDMKWDLEPYSMGREKFMQWEKSVVEKLGDDLQQP
jgi:uncharacterized protein (DUF169 family)